MDTFENKVNINNSLNDLEERKTDETIIRKENNLIKDFNNLEDDDFVLTSENQNYVKELFSLSTIDNPFNPFEDFENWYSFDCEMGHDCCSILARIVGDTEGYTKLDLQKKIESSIDFIVMNDLTGTFIKVQKTIE